MTDEQDHLWELQATLLFAVLVAGKSERFARKVVFRLLHHWCLPFDTIKDLISREGELEKALRKARSGSYTRLLKCLPQLVELNPETCTVEDLEAVPGVGPKTARAFLLWTRPESRYAALDTHILKFLRALGYEAPRSTPVGKRYRELERIFLKEADRRGVTPAELDSEVWEGYARKSKQQTVMAL